VGQLLAHPCNIQHKCRVVFHKRISLPQVATESAKATASSQRGRCGKNIFLLLAFG